LIDCALHSDREQTGPAVCSLFFLALAVAWAAFAACTSSVPPPESTAPDSGVDTTTVAPPPVVTDPAAGLRARADSLFDAGAYEAALPLLEAACEDDPGDYRLHMRVGWIHLDRDDYSEAVDAYRDAVDANPKSVDARVGLAKAYEGDGRIDSAIRAYEKAISVHGLDATVAPLVLAQANLYNRKGRYDRAVELIESTRSAFELTAGLNCAYGMALAGEGRYDDAVAAFTAATGDARYADFAWAQIRRIRSLQGR
jgi:tetratricopeptide (TPR) repeat protein